MSTLNQEVNTLGSDVKQNLLSLKQNIDDLPGILEDKILARVEGCFNRRT